MPGIQLPSVAPAGNPLGGQKPGTYNLAQLEALWIQAGGSAASAPTAAAIAMAESSGNPSAHNPSGATGLWQILGNPFPGNASDPLTNAKMAVAKYKAANGWSPWVTYTSGAYKQYLSDATNAMATVDTGTSTLDQALNAPSAVVGAVGSTASSVASIASLLTSGSFWLRIGEAIAGIALLFMGLRSLTGNTTTPITVAQGAAKTAAKAAVVA